MEEVKGSIPLCSTPSLYRRTGYTLGGLVAGEGCYCRSVRRERFTADDSARYRFFFELTMADRDRAIIEQLQRFLQCGQIREIAPRQAHHLPTVRLWVRSERTLIDRVIPFSEEFLLPSAKRRQYERWRDWLFAYRRDRPTQWGRGPSTCSVDGCERPVRGRGLCRSHYHQVTGY